MTAEQKKEEAKPPSPLPAPVQPAAPIPSPPLPSAETKPPKKEKTPQEKEERVKQARALLDQQIKAIAKRENLPENLIRMELYLENRMRKTILPKIDRLQSDMRELQHGVGAIGSLLVKHGNGPQESPEPPLEPYPDIVEPASAVAAQPSPPPFDEAAHQNDPLFGTMLLYLVGGGD